MGNAHTDSVSYQGNIFTKQKKKYWGVLNDFTISFYANSNSIEMIPFDVVNVAEFYQMERCDLNHPTFCFGIKFLDVYGNKKMLYSFKEKKNRNRWYNSIRKIRQGYQSVNNGQNPHTHMVYGGFVLCDYKLSFMTLTCDNNLYLYQQKCVQNTNPVTIINLDECQTIQPFTVDKDTKTLFKYGFKLKLSDVGEKTFLFKRCNNRFEWMTHIDFAMNNQTFKDHEQFVTMDGEGDNKSNNENNPTTADAAKSFKLILSCMRLYDKWLSENSDGKKDNNLLPLISTLQNELNVTYMDLINHFHEITTHKYVENQYIKEYKCTHDKNICESKSRYLKRGCKEHCTGKNVLWYQLLDKIHCYIYHSFAVRDNSSAKFVMNVTENNATNDEKIDENDDEKIDEKSKDNDEYDSKSIFAFGEDFLYYEVGTQYENYIRPQFSCLKEELIRNPYYPLDIDTYDEYYVKAVALKKSKVFVNMKAKWCGKMNEIAGVYENDPISINHIISLLVYCHEDEAQTVYKQNCRKMFKNETLKSVFKRHSYIAHWTRYLYECCQFYGETLASNQSVYCGINAKLLFSGFNIINYAPLSTTSSSTVAQNFAANSGLIIKLQSNTKNCRYFDMMLVSDHTREQEKFFCGKTILKICDIIIGQSYEKYVNALQLLQLILSGTIFYYAWNQKLFDDEIQDILIELLRHFMDSKNVSCRNDQQNDESVYFQQLTNVLMESFLHRNVDNDPYFRYKIFINISQIKNLNEKLSVYFYNASCMSNKGILFAKNQIQVHFIERIHKKCLHKAQLKLLQQMKYYTGKAIEIFDFIVDFDERQIKFMLTFEKRKLENQLYFVIF
eukprot:373736_1